MIKLFQFFFFLFSILVLIYCENQAVENNKAIKKKISNLSLNFDYGEYQYVIGVPKDEALFNFFRKQPKVYSYEGDKPPKNWKTQYYSSFLGASEDEKFLLGLINNIKNEANCESELELIQLLISFVQGGLTYDKLKSANLNGDLQYPYETVFLGKGVCSDKTVLMGKLLLLMDFEIGFFIFPKANHMALGIRVPTGEGNFNTDFCFIETTRYARIGIVPGEYEGGVKLEGNPELVVPYKNGKRVFTQYIEYAEETQILEKAYGEEFFLLAPKEQKLFVEIKLLSKKIETMKRNWKQKKCDQQSLNNMQMQVCIGLSDSINLVVINHNKIVKLFNNHLDVAE